MEYGSNFAPPRDKPYSHGVMPTNSFAKPGSKSGETDKYGTQNTVEATFREAASRVSGKKVSLK